MLVKNLGEGSFFFSIFSSETVPKPDLRRRQFERGTVPNTKTLG
jgi:hypothetical protein